MENIVIKTYSPKYSHEIISLILKIQNDEAKINLTLEEQPDLKDIEKFYQAAGGEFWIALDKDKVIGTIGLMNKGNGYAVLKKFFVDTQYRRQKIGLMLYKELLSFALKIGIKHIILDTPSVAKASHNFYECAGFRQIQPEQLPISYSYPDRNSLIYILDL